MSKPCRIVVLLGLVLTVSLCLTPAASAEGFAWSGGGPETATSSAANWLGDIAPVSLPGIGGLRETATDARHGGNATLRIVVRALPRPLSAKLVIAGPRHLRRRVSHSVSLKLPAGVYTLSTGPVQAAAGAYYATTPRENQQLRAGRVTTVTVSYATLVPKTTRVVPASGTVSLVGEPSGPHVLTLTGSAAHDARVGQFLASGSTAPAPNGYLVKVTKVTHKSNGTAVLDVQNATLLEALPSGEIAAEQLLEPPAEAASLNKGGALNLTFGHRGTRSAHTAGFSLHTTNLTCHSSAGVHVEKPAVTFSPSIALHAHWGFFKLDSASFTATVAASLAMSANAEAGASCETNNPGIGLLPHPISLPDIDVQVGPIPVVITPRLQVYLSGNASITAKVSVSLEQSASATVGASYEHGSFAPISSFSQHFTPSFTAEGDASGELALTPTLDTLIYGIAGPSFDLGAVAKLNADVKKTPWWTLQACLQAGLGFVISPLGLNWSDPHLIQLCKTLLSATGAPPAGAIAASSPPANTSPPTITDEQGNSPPKVGDTLRAGSGSWTGSPAEYTYHWEDCKPAGTCTSNLLASAAPTYKLTEHDLGETLRVIVTALNGAGASQPAPSAETGAVTKGASAGKTGYTVTAITTDGAHTCSLFSGGRVECWGANSLDQLGDGTSAGPESCGESPGAPCSRTPVSVDDITDATAIAAGNSYTCALLGTGHIDCWGYEDGALGVPFGEGWYEPTSQPVTVSGISSAVAIAAGDETSCALLAAGSVECWGFGADGELGDGSMEAGSDTPVPVSGITDATAITSGLDHECALLANHTVDCWGGNAAGMVGDGESTGPEECNVSGSGVPCSTTPVAVSGITDAMAIASGGIQTCAILTGGKVACWGSNESGELGDGTSTGPEECAAADGDRYSRDFCSDRPVLVEGITNAVALSGGEEHMCALLASGAVDCWGENRYGQLGDGTRTGPETCEEHHNPCGTTPVAADGITDATAIAAGQWNSCALLDVGSVDCWGENYAGQLGDGTTEESDVPVAVSGIE